MEAKKTNDILAKIISDNSNLNYDFVKGNLNKDLWFDSDQALKYGIVDKLVTKGI